MGVGDGEYIIASDASALVEHTNRVVYLNDGEIVVVRRDGYEVRTIDNEVLTKTVHELELELAEIEKSGYEHFMLKEIMEQPTSVDNCMRGRLRIDDNQIVLGGLLEVEERLATARRIIICGCGTSLARSARG